MLKIGLTGSIGSGKSTVASIFESLGVKVFYADISGRKHLNSKNVKAEIRSVFGDSVFNSDSEINRKVLADVVFNDNEKLKKINSIIHPLVERDFTDWMISNSSEQYIIHEAAIIFEAGLQNNFDEIISVSAAIDIRLSRIIKRDKIEKEDFFKRVESQWEDDKKNEIADHVIINDEENMLIPQVIKLHKKILDKVKK